MIVNNVGTATNTILDITIPVSQPGENGHDGDGSGDMVRATYDTNGNGIVDDSERLGGELPSHYVTTDMLASASPVTSVAGRIGDVILSPIDVGLGNVNNTSDASKPISMATQTALDGKANKEHLHIPDDITGLTESSAITKTGRLVTLNGLQEGLPLDVTAKLVATQEGSGEPSPENVRRIVGPDSANVKQTGKNLFDVTKPKWVSATATASNATASSGSIRITLTGTAVVLHPGTNENKHK